MFRQAHQHKALRDMALSDHMQSPGWQPTLCVFRYPIWWFESLEKDGHTWHWMSLLRPAVIKQHKPNPTLMYKASEAAIKIEL